MPDADRTREMEERIEGWLGDERTRAALLLELAPSVPEKLVRDFVRFAREIEEPLSRFLILQALSERASGSLREEVRREAGRAAEAVPDAEQRTAAMLHLHEKGRVPLGAVLETIDESRIIADPLLRARALAGVTQNLLRDPKGFQGADALRTFEALSRQLEVPAHDRGYPGTREALAQVTGDFLRGIAGRLTAREQWAALQTARTIGDENLRASTLVTMAPLLRDELRTEGVMAARELVGEEARARALIGFVPELGQAPGLQVGVAREALGLAHSIRHWQSQAAGFRRLNQGIPDAAVEDALSAELALRGAGVKSRALASLAPRLELDQLDQVAGAAVDLPHSWGKVHLLESARDRAGSLLEPRARRLARELEDRLQEIHWSPSAGYAAYGTGMAQRARSTGAALYDVLALRPRSFAAHDAEIASFVRWNPEAAADILVRRLRGEPPMPASPAYPRESSAARRVDIGIERLGGRDVFEGIDPEQALQPGQAYRLRVHVGTPLPASLVVGEVPPIDGLLPAPDDGRGHELDVVVFPKTFQLRSPAVQPLRLPLRGSSAPVFFTVNAPEKPGRAEMRIAVYHRGHMVQSFLLTAPVGEFATKRDRVQVRLDFAATEQLVTEEIEMLGERALSVGVNQDAGGSHTFMVKRGGTAEGFTLDETLVSRHVGEFRKLLEDATFVPPITPGQEKPRFNSYPDPGAETDPVFHGYVRLLADFGRNLYDMLQGKLSDAGHEEVRSLAEVSDKVIQVVRHDANMAFPWGIIYDYPLDSALVGAPTRPVCLGSPLPELGAAPASTRKWGCPHNPGHDVYCIEGFWGVRHRIEQRIGRTAGVETVVRRPAGRPGVMLATGIEDENANELAKQLGDDLGAELALLRKDDDLLDLLWDPARRPAVLVVLGHLETGHIQGEPPGPRIVLLPKSTWPPPAAVPKRHWLMPPAVTGMTQERGRWKDDPRTLVLLMACCSAATEVGTLNDLVTSLTPLGVGAVVGTETPVFTRLAARFAAEVTLSLWNDSRRTLGEAVQGFNRALIRSGNPLAFAFTCIGNADLTLSP
ncbi:MAG TPA: hypothetical protein VF584_06060 [Longimicrobium sp.]|jgi:hypothetical protein